MARVIVCTSLKNGLLSAKVEGDFLCLSGSDVFPVSLKETTNKIPSKLLIRSFHNEVMLIIKKLRNDHKIRGTTGGAIFFGPSGSGKSWAAEAVLVDELREAEESGKTVVYFDTGGMRAFVFSKERNVLIRGIASPDEIDIPELMVRDTVLIYDAVRGTRDSLTCFPCEYLIFSSPSAGNFKHVAGTNGLVTFVCPKWTVEELQVLAHGYGDRIPPEEVLSRFERFGGSPRAVVANETSISETQEREASLLLTGIELWSDLIVWNADWPCSLLKARYSTEETAVTPEEAFNKYLEKNVIWEYSNSRAMELVHAKYDRADEATRRKFQSWLESESKASALHGNWFKYKTRSLFHFATGEDIEVKAMDANDGLSKDEQENLTSVLNKENRHLAWKIPVFKEIHDATMVKKGKKYNLADLKELTDPAVLYRLPDGFPLMDYYNPPNNCFSLGVGGHKIYLDHAVDLCTNVIPAKHQVNFVYVTPSRNYGNVKGWHSFDTGSGGTKTLGMLPSGTVRVLSRMVQFCMRFKKG
mmetsp:Transcript_10110/g.13877  ORF Transcript_10110/g.13877 Transcript_10110/m.13877 type:complete len:528 (+) Transcript_10110:111-1694(+)